MVSPSWRKLKVDLNYPRQQLNTFAKTVEQYDPDVTVLEEEKER